MKILALETSSITAGVAVIEGDELLWQRTLEASQRTARCLAPAMRDALAAAGWSPRDVELVAVTAGSGSFTGLRIGVTTAKTFAYATGAQVLGVNTLEAVAARAPEEATELECVLDAQRNQLFAASFHRHEDGQLRPSGKTRIVNVEEWLDTLSPSSPLHVSGPALTKLIARLPKSALPLDEVLWTPTAETVARLARREFQAGTRGDVWRLVPDYFRPSAAEEKLGRG